MTRLSGRLERLQTQVEQASDDILVAEVRRLSQSLDVPFEVVLEEARLIQDELAAGKWEPLDFNSVEDVARSVGIIDSSRFHEVRDTLHRIGYTDAA